jgi:hypothetical protein
VLVLVCLLVPLPKGSTVNKEVIHRIWYGIMGGRIVWAHNLRASYMYKAKKR